MNRRLTALLAAFEALLVVAIGVAIPLLPLTLMWAFQYGLAIDWTVFWRASVDIWLLGHGVDVRLTLDPLAAAALGPPGAEAPVLVTIAPLGFALLTGLLGVRAGRRTAEIGNRMLGAIVSLASFVSLSLLVTFSALHPAARPSLWQGALLPTLVFAVGLTIGLCLDADDAGRRVRAWLQSWPNDTRLVAVTAVRGGTAAAAAVIAVSAAVTTAAIALAYARIITLYESLHGEVLGGIAITLGQLALLPNLVIWTASWLIGPGFSIGTGSLVSPLGTQLGPLPALPVLGALPTGEFGFGFVGLAVPLVVGFLVGMVLGQRLPGRLGRRQRGLAGLATGVVGGALLGLLAWSAAGSAGPGRLEHVGSDPWAVGICAAVEIAVGCVIGMLVSRRGAPTAGKAGR